MNLLCEMQIDTLLCVGGIIKRIVLPKENIYFSKTDESLRRKAIGPVKWQPATYEIAKKYMGKMYDRFFRAVDTRVNQIRGSGLGLPVVKELTELSWI